MQSKDAFFSVASTINRLQVAARRIEDVMPGLCRHGACPTDIRRGGWCFVQPMDRKVVLQQRCDMRLNDRLSTNLDNCEFCSLMNTEVDPYIRPTQYCWSIWHEEVRRPTDFATASTLMTWRRFHYEGDPGSASRAREVPMARSLMTLKNDGPQKKAMRCLKFFRRKTASLEAG